MLVEPSHSQTRRLFFKIMFSTNGGAMAERSRIRFNPVTKEIDIEGSESFVKTYFSKLQNMISGAPEAIVEEPKAVKAPKRKPAKKVRQSKKTPKVATETKRGALSKAVLALIHGSPEGIAMAELKEKTGLKDSQIRNIISSVTKQGKIRKMKRGVYGAA
jgi:hypothetical protein